MSEAMLDFSVFAVSAMGNITELRFKNETAMETKTITVDGEYIYLDFECSTSTKKGALFEKMTGAKIKYSEFYKMKNHLEFFKEHLDYASYAPDSSLYMGGYKLYVEVEDGKTYDFGGNWNIKRIIDLLLENRYVMDMEDEDFK